MRSTKRHFQPSRTIQCHLAAYACCAAAGGLLPMNQQPSRSNRRMQKSAGEPTAVCPWTCRDRREGMPSNQLALSRAACPSGCHDLFAAAACRRPRQTCFLPRTNVKIPKGTGSAFALSCDHTCSGRPELGWGPYGVRVDIASNHSVEANRHPAAPLEAGRQLGWAFSAQRDVPAVVAHLWR